MTAAGSTPIGARDWSALLVVTTGAVLIHGYHLGIEDQTLYLPAIKKILNPVLYPHDAIYFASQTGFTLLPRMVAWSVRLSHLPLDLVVFVWHVVSLAALLLGCLSLARRCVPERAAQWCGVVAVALLLPCPVAGTRIGLMDPFLHPRALATTALLFAMIAAMDLCPWKMLSWLAAAAALHPLMALAGAIHVIGQAWPTRGSPVGLDSTALASPIVTASIAGAPVQTPTMMWRDTVWSVRRFYFPSQWSCREWTGVMLPLVVLGWLTRLGPKRGLPVLTRVSRRLLLSAVAGTVLAIALTSAPTPLVLLQPMRTLHLVYVVLFLLAGCAFGRRFLRASPRRWLAFLIAQSAIVLVLQQRFPSSPHIEWPGAIPQNAWVAAFDWARRNTPPDALFALDPQYMRRPGSDGHSFRAFAERSMLAEAVHDPGPALMSEELTARWRDEVRATERWRDFTGDDFRRLRVTRGVSWIVVERPPSGLACPYRNATIAVCRVD